MARSARRPPAFAGWRWELLGHVRGRVLEIGCGFGDNFEYYPVGAAVTASDVKAERLRTAVRQRAPIDIALADA